jgi:hypothetical protein
VFGGEVEPPSTNAVKDASVRKPCSRSKAPESRCCSSSRLRRLEDGRYEYTPKHKAARAFSVTAEQLVRRLVSLVPPAKTVSTPRTRLFAHW